MGTGRGLRRLGAALVPLVMLLAACGDDSDSAAADDDDGSADESTEPSGDAAETMRIHVTNDDGIDSPGIDSVVEALKTLDEVELFIIAPVRDWSGSGDSKCEDKPDEERLTVDEVAELPDDEPTPCTYDGEGLVSSEAETASGEAATAVHGTPADTVTWAHENVFVDDVEPPHLTVSGNNGGQNIGVLAYVSGTVGATRESARHGVPGFAVSQGLGEETADYDELDYAAAVPFLLDWIEDNREALLNGDLAVDTVTSLNVPTCTDGEVRGLHETERASDGDALAPVDCTSEDDPEGLDDVEAFQAAFATITDVDVEEPDAGRDQEEDGEEDQ